MNAALYVYASSSTRSRLFKISFPYAKPPGSLGINVDQADIVDSSQYLPTSKNPANLLLGQYVGELKTPRPGSPPPPPADVLGQFDEPLDPTKGLIPNVHLDTIVGGLIADPPRELVYTLSSSDGSLSLYGLPMQPNAKAKFTLRCPGGPSNCDHPGEHLFLAP